MNESKTVRNEILINAPASAVWDILTQPEQTKKYMYACEPITDWKVGSPLLWRGEWEGKKMDFVKGNVVSIEPGKHLVYSVIDPNNAAIPDVPENYLTVTYTLTEQDNGTQLVVTQGDYSRVAEGEKRYNDAVNAGGWSSILEQIKNIAEGK
ncbi:SRPBCC family protein [Chitinophagaceae bacterium MMS25-I14]